MPHLGWLARNDFVSIRFQLGREPDYLNPDLILEYVIGQVGAGGLVVGAILFYALCRTRSDSPFERVLRLNCLGFFAFFLAMSLKGKVEANWTMAAFVPLAVLGHSYLQRHRRLRRAAMWSALLPIALIIAVKVVFVFPPEDSQRLKRAYEFSDWEAVTGQVLEAAEGLPLVANTYPHASSLAFYSGQMVPALNIRSRPNQFDLWRLEDRLGDRKVCFISNFELPGAAELKLRQGDTIWLKKPVTLRALRNR
jgi:hypothetical protein